MTFKSSINEEGGGGEGRGDAEFFLVEKFKSCLFFSERGEGVGAGISLDEFQEPPHHTLLYLLRYCQLEESNVF